MKPFCVKTKAIGYAIFEVGRSKKEERRRWRNQRFSRFLVMISAVYSSYMYFGVQKCSKTKVSCL